MKKTHICASQYAPARCATAGGRQVSAWLGLLWRVFALSISLLASAASACPTATGSTLDPEFRLRHSQRRTLPVLQGVGYDVPGQRVFISACRRRAYACDLLVVGLDGRTQQEAAYFRGPSGRYGYVWPAVSPDGRYLAVVRTLREQRPSQRNVTHELLRIDLETGEEHVLATAGDGRFDRVVYADNRTIIVVRSFRSSSGARCTPDSCTDWAEVLLVREGSVSTLPNQIAGPPFRVSITPLGVAGPLWISASTRQIESFASGIPRGRGVAWVVDLEEGASAEATRAPDMHNLLTQVERRHGSLGGWTPQVIVAGRVGMLEGQPFCDTRAEMATLNQTTLADSRRGVFVAKLRSGRRLTFQIGTVENRGVVPWAPASETLALYPLR
jgi:hypothetical protein